MCLKKFRYMYFKNPLHKQPKFPYNMREVTAYAAATGKRMNELTEDELKRFVISNDPCHKSEKT